MYQQLKKKNILLGVTGSIAAYKVIHLVRLLVEQGADVTVLLTQEAQKFVTPLCLSVASGKQVHVDFVSESGTWVNHVHLSQNVDLFLIVPATLNTLSKFAQGVCDNLLTATYFSATCPIVVVPVMDHDMYLHPQTRKNINQLQENGNLIIPPIKGPLASGLVGEGRMREPEELLRFINVLFSTEFQKPLKNKKVLVTAGPTYEAIDPVRFIGNHSSGLMGIMLAEVAFIMGAEVTLVLGPSQHTVTSNIKVERITTAEELYQKVSSIYEGFDLMVCAAAVSDFQSKEIQGRKIKNKDQFSLELSKTKDTLYFLGQNKKDQVLVGFALETDNEIHNAKTKLEHKNLDMIVLNSLKDECAGFGHETNKVSLIDRKGQTEMLPLMSKLDVAVCILNRVHTQFL